MAQSPKTLHFNGELVAQIREERGYTQQELADGTGFTLEEIIALENNDMDKLREFGWLPN